MSGRRASGKRPGTTDWRQSERRSEIVKAVGAAGGVVLLTALIIFLLKPGDSPSSTQTPIPQTPVTNPTGSTPAGSLPTDSTATTAPSTPPSSTAAP
jgi:hypothetical protein